MVKHAKGSSRKKMKVLDLDLLPRKAKLASFGKAIERKNTFHNLKVKHKFKV
jgi:hypothetical protein